MGPVREVSRAHGFYAVIIGVFSTSILWGTFQAYLPLFGKEVLGLPGPQIGYLLAIIAIFNGLSRLPAGWIVDRAARKGTIVMVGVLAMALGLVVLPHLRGFWAPALVMSAAVPFSAAAFIAVSVTFSGLASERTRGIAMGIYGTFLYLGLGAGPALFGGLFQVGYVEGFTATAAFATLLVGVMAILRSEPLQRRRRVVPIPPPAPGT